MNRAELQQLARDRVRDAKALLAAHRWSGAYYLAGYAVECALKSCVIVYLMKTDQFPERRFSEQCWAHTIRTQSLNYLLGRRSRWPRSLAGAFRRSWGQRLGPQPA
jgi:hypothetical protein